MRCRASQEMVPSGTSQEVRTAGKGGMYRRDELYSLSRPVRPPQSSCLNSFMSTLSEV